MRPSLADWMGDADGLRHLEFFHAAEIPEDMWRVRYRADDYYIDLIGELFDRLRRGAPEGPEWSRLGDAISEFAVGAVGQGIGVNSADALLLAATAYYCGGFPASAYLTIRSQEPIAGGPYGSCYDMLARPRRMVSEFGTRLISALERGDLAGIGALRAEATELSRTSLSLGANEWIPARLAEKLVARFSAANVRAVLPDGGDHFWDPLVSSLLSRDPPIWEFFPSQVAAVQGGLLERDRTFSMQMPTGAGKTALCETLLYWHANQDGAGAAILLVPYRALASELRGSMVRRLNAMGVQSRCAYGGTVPTGGEVRGLDETRVLVSTPEALEGLLTADREFSRRIDLVICDEGHLLDGGSRGIGLELLLARMRAREGGAPRFVFVSAIVPNIEEINIWLGGTAESVVRSDYRPALAEFGVLQTSGRGTGQRVDLVLHPEEPAPARLDVSGFLSSADFQWFNGTTGRPNTYAFTTIKTQAVAAARRVLELGSVAIFAANKRGNQGAEGIAEELVHQLAHPLPLPDPRAYVVSASLDPALEFMELEFGREWIGSRALAAGAVLHHGDVPQEARDVLEGLVRRKAVRLAICTNTLAEGVNLPIRTLVLYSLRRRLGARQIQDLLTRDIKNLVGRSGRAGSTTKGMVICANEDQWPMLAPVVRGEAGESVHGALLSMTARLRRALHGDTLTNEMLEATPNLYTLVDGIDSTLVDLASEELGEEALVAMAVRLADETFAAVQADADEKGLLEEVFGLRARRVASIHTAGRLTWIRETGARLRMVDAVESDLAGRLDDWSTPTGPTDPSLLSAVLTWAWGQPDLQQAVHEAFRQDDQDDTDDVRDAFFQVVTAWLAGARYVEMAAESGLDVDLVLAVQVSVMSYVLQSAVEQGIALLEKALAEDGKGIGAAVRSFPEHLRFGVPTAHARILASEGIRHRSAAVQLGSLLQTRALEANDANAMLTEALELLQSDRAGWENRLGRLVVANTVADLTSALQSRQPHM